MYPGWGDPGVCSALHFPECAPLFIYLTSVGHILCTSPGMNEWTATGTRLPGNWPLVEEGWNALVKQSHGWLYHRRARGTVTLCLREGGADTLNKAWPPDQVVYLL